MDELFSAVCNTIAYTFISTTICIMLSSWIVYNIIFKIKKNSIKIILLLIFMLPSLLSSVSNSIIWKYLFTYNYGFINNILVSLGGTKIYWLTEYSFSLFILCSANIIRATGYYMLFFIPAMLQVPQNIFRASIIDGASHKTIYLKQIMPYINPYLKITLLLCLIDNLKQYDLHYLILGNKAMQSANINTLFTLYYKYFYTINNRAMACAIAVIGIIVIVFVLIMFLIAFKIIYG